MLSTLRLVLEGWRITYREIRRLVGLLMACLCGRLGRRSHDKSRRVWRKYRDVRCTRVPNDIRARPDPYLYSQDWLSSRGLAVVWDNPDFQIIDVATGLPVGRFDLLPNKDYDIEVSIHNNSFMAAIGIQVRFEVCRFGAGTGVTDDLGSVVIDVPGAGTAKARRRWHTPASGGHNCLRAIISHPDDANPLNNVGQHNTDVAVPASPTRQLRFLVGNDGRVARTVALTMNAYRLPQRVGCAENYRERQGLKYLRRLQDAHHSDRFPVPDYLHARLTHAALKVEPGQELEVTLELTPPAKGRGIHSVNVNAYDGARLIGGITAYVLEENS